MATTEEEKNPIKQADTIFDTAIDAVEQHTSDSIAAIDNYKATQEGLAQEQLDHVIQRVEQQKAQMQQDYNKEQSAAYVDYQKEVDPYGVQAEQVAASGLSNSGYAESLKTQAYVAYQNRVAVARQAYQQAVVDYDNAMIEARMQNSVAMAQLAFQTLQMRLETALSGFQYKNSLVMEKANTRYKIAQENPEAWVEVLEQIYAAENGSADTGANVANATGANETVNNPTVYTDRDSAIEVLKANGVNYKPMSERQWEMGHNANTPVKDYNYGSYGEYLTAFVKRYLSNT